MEDKHLHSFLEIQLEAECGSVHKPQNISPWLQNPLLSIYSGKITEEKDKNKRPTICTWMLITVILTH